MAYIKIETNNAIYYINLEQHDNFVDSIPKNVKLDAASAEMSLQEPGFTVYGVDTRSLFIDEIKKKKLQERAKEIFFLDPGVWAETARLEIRKAEKKLRPYKLGAILAKLFAAPAGIVAVGKLIHTIATNGKEAINRRTFLKYGALIALLSSPFILHDFLESAGKVSLKKGEASTYRKLGLRFREYIAGKGMVFTRHFRNAVITERLEAAVAPKLKSILGRKPIIGVYMGAEHGLDLERMLKNPKRRRAYVRVAREYISSRMAPTGYYGPRIFRWDSSKKRFEESLNLEEWTAKKGRGRARKTGKGAITRRQFFAKAFRRRV